MSQACSVSRGCELQNYTLKCNQIVDYKTINSNVTVLELCDLTSDAIPLDRLLVVFPHLDNLTIVNTEIPVKNLFQAPVNITVSSKMFIIYY